MFKNIILGIGWALAGLMMLVTYDLSQENIQYEHDNTILANDWGKTQSIQVELMLRGWTQDEIDEFVVKGCIDYYVGVGK